MTVRVPAAPKPPTIKTIFNDDWKNGLVTAYDDGRTPINGLRSSVNTVLTQDGVVRPRPSLQRWGPQPTGTILGQIYQWRKVTGAATEEWLISMQVVAGVGNIYVARPEDTSWTKDGNAVAFSATAKARFNQLDSRIVITNGENKLAYFDIATSKVVVFSAISNAGAPTLTVSTALVGTAYKVWYMVTANSKVGETTGIATEQAISTTRIFWKDDGTQSVTVAWTAVTNADSYNIYVASSADSVGNKVWALLASGLNAGTTTFVDDGSTDPNYFITPPEANTTDGPICKRSEIINGRIWLTGDTSDVYRVRWGGDPKYEFDFTRANGGGYIPIGKGREIPERIWNFRSGQGEAQIKCLTKGVAGAGKRYTIEPTTLTISGTPATVWGATEDYGYSGTDSGDGLVVYGNSTYYISRDGVKVLGTKTQLQNLLSNDNVSQTIEDSLGTINADAMDGCVGMGFEDRIYWALPISSSTNNEVWVMDLGREGAWMKWYMPVDWMTIVTDNNGYAHHVVLSKNVLYQLSYATKTSDDGVAFITSGQTGLIPFSKDARQWGRMIRAVVEVLRLQGVINFELNGFTNERKVEQIGVGSISATVVTNGYGWGENTWANAGWGLAIDAPALDGDIAEDVLIKINKDVRYFSLSWFTSGANVDYGISKIVAEYVSVGVKNLK